MHSELLPVSAHTPLALAHTLDLPPSLLPLPRFYKTPPEEVADAGVQASFSGGAGTSSETANGLSPSGSGSMSSAEIAQLQLAALTLAFSTAGEGGDVVGSSGSLAGDVEPSLLDDLD
jgi:hypothetical protein